MKELQLSEGRTTGIPTIQDELRRNSSEPARIETDEDRTYFLIEIPCRDGFENKVITSETIPGTINGTINERDIVIMTELSKQPGMKKNELAEKLALSVRTISRILQNLSSDSLDFIKYYGSKKTGGYVLTEKGHAYLTTLK